MRAALLGVCVVSLCSGLAACVDVPDPIDPADARSDGPTIPSDRGMAPDAMADGAPPVDAMAGMDGAPFDGRMPDASLDAMPTDANTLDAIVDGAAPVVDAESDMARPPAPCALDDLYAAEVGLCVRFEAFADMPQPVIDPQLVALDDGSLLVINQRHFDMEQRAVRPSTYLLEAGSDVWQTIDGPDGRRSATLTHVPGGGTFYAGGRRDDIDIGTPVQHWQANAQLWASDEDAVQHRYLHAAVAFRGHVVLIGGQDEEGALDTVYTLAGGIQEVPIVNLPTARHGHLAVATADELLVFGGVVGGQPSGASVVWSEAAGWQWIDDPLPVPSDGVGIATDGATVVLGGGGDGAGGETDALFVWREADGWVAVDPLALGRKDHTITALDDDLFLVVGSDTTVELIRTDTGQRSTVQPPDRFDTQRERHAAVALGQRSAAILGGRVDRDVQGSAWRVSVYDAEARALGPQ